MQLGIIIDPNKQLNTAELIELQKLLNHADTHNITKITKNKKFSNDTYAYESIVSKKSNHIKPGTFIDDQNYTIDLEKCSLIKFDECFCIIDEKLGEGESGIVKKLQKYYFKKDNEGNYQQLIFNKQNMSVVKIFNYKNMREKSNDLLTLEYFEESIRREFKVLKDLDENVENVALIFSDDGKKAYIKMSFVPGQTLEDYLNNNLDISFQKRLEIMNSLAEAVQKLHRLKYCHFDLKIQNIMIEEADGKIKVTLIDAGSIIPQNTQNAFSKIAFSDFFAPYFSTDPMGFEANSLAACLGLLQSDWRKFKCDPTTKKMNYLEAAFLEQKMKSMKSRSRSRSAADGYYNFNALENDLCVKDSERINQKQIILLSRQLDQKCNNSMTYPKTLQDLIDLITNILKPPEKGVPAEKGVEVLFRSSYPPYQYPNQYPSYRQASSGFFPPKKTNEEEKEMVKEANTNPENLNNDSKKIGSKNNQVMPLNEDKELVQESKFSLNNTI
jgi:tRNA A-37 threonylcarbamoyl transferase component Bud32